MRHALAEDHWDYLDRFADVLIARGPTMTDDGVLTGSVHILAVADAAAAREFAYREPTYQAGGYRDVMIRRWRDVSGRTMWEAGVKLVDRSRFLVIGFTALLDGDGPELPRDAPVIVSGALLSDDGAHVLGAALLVDADSADEASSWLPVGPYLGVEVHRWRPGGRPA